MPKPISMDPGSGMQQPLSLDWKNKFLILWIFDLELVKQMDCIFEFMLIFAPAKLILKLQPYIIE